jgi:hypothetical protein
MSANCEHSNESVGAIKGMEFLWPKWLNMTEYCGRINSSPAWYLVDLAGINLGPKTSYTKISQQYNGTTLLARCDVFVVSRWCDAVLCWAVPRGFEGWRHYDPSRQHEPLAQCHGFTSQKARIFNMLLLCKVLKLKEQYCIKCISHKGQCAVYLCCNVCNQCHKLSGKCVDKRVW